MNFYRSITYIITHVWGREEERRGRKAIGKRKRIFFGEDILIVLVVHMKVHRSIRRSYIGRRRRKPFMTICLRILLTAGSRVGSLWGVIMLVSFLKWRCEITRLTVERQRKEEWVEGRLPACIGAIVFMGFFLNCRYLLVFLSRCQSWILLSYHTSFQICMWLLI